MREREREKKRITYMHCKMFSSVIRFFPVNKSHAVFLLLPGFFGSFFILNRSNGELHNVRCFFFPSRMYVQFVTAWNIIQKPTKFERFVVGVVGGFPISLFYLYTQHFHAQ